MSHYDPPTREDRQRRRNRDKQRKQAIQNVLSNNDVQKDLENFIQKQGRIKREDAVQFIKNQYIEEDWLGDLITPKTVARRVFTLVRDRYGPRDEKYIRKNREVYYTYEKTPTRSP